MSGFEKFKKESPSKEKFYSLLTGEKISDKECEHVVWIETKTVKDYHDLHLECHVYC